jgi:hypothetical protein
VRFAASLAAYAAVNLRAFFARTGNLLSTENPTLHSTAGDSFVHCHRNSVIPKPPRALMLAKVFK